MPSPIFMQKIAQIMQDNVSAPKSCKGRRYERSEVVMAFLVEARMEGYEVRGVDSGTSKANKPWRSVRVESGDGRSGAEISTSDANMFAAVDALQKGDIADFMVRLVSGKERSYIVLIQPPVVHGNAYGNNSIGY